MADLSRWDEPNSRCLYDGQIRDMLALPVQTKQGVKSGVHRTAQLAPVQTGMPRTRSAISWRGPKALSPGRVHKTRGDRPTIPQKVSRAAPQSRGRAGEPTSRIRISSLYPVREVGCSRCCRTALHNHNNQCAHSWPRSADIGPFVHHPCNKRCRDDPDFRATPLALYVEWKVPCLVFHSRSSRPAFLTHVE
jgi:hypothetical protein